MASINLIKRKIKILVICPHPKDATSFYRGMGPMNHLERNFDVEFHTADFEINWATIGRYDILFMQRPATPQHLQALEMAQKCGLKVVVDYDDNVFDVPADNPAWRYYSITSNKECILKIMKQADAVMVSTEELLEKYSRINPRCFHIPNAIDERIINGLKHEKREKVVTWRGSDTHQRDLMHYKDEIIEAAKAFPDFKFLFLGWMPWFIGEEIVNQFEFKASANPIEFLRVAYLSKSYCHIVPLHDSPFNHAKSNIAWLEMSLIGARVIAPIWKEWQVPGCSHYTNKEGFKRSLFQMLSEYDENIHQDVTDSNEFIRSNLTLAQTNKGRFKIFSNLIN